MIIVSTLFNLYFYPSFLPFCKLQPIFSFTVPFFVSIPFLREMADLNLSSFLPFPTAPQKNGRKRKKQGKKKEKITEEGEQNKGKTDGAEERDGVDD